MTTPRGSIGSGSQGSTHGTRDAARGVVVVAICLGLLVAGTGVAVANPGNQGKSCPGENQNVGYENADQQGAVSSLPGIVEAALAIGCHEAADSQT